MINYTMAREHFLDMGEQVHKHIYDINLAWGQFLDFYSDLNNARKAHEDSFVERNYIGEELVEPAETPYSSEELVDNFAAENPRQRNAYFEAFDDGFDDLASKGSMSDRKESVIKTQPLSGSGNLLGALQREIMEEESKGPLLLDEDRIKDEPGEILQIEEEKD